VRRMKNNDLIESRRAGIVTKARTLDGAGGRVAPVLHGKTSTEINADYYFDHLGLERTTKILSISPGEVKKETGSFRNLIDRIEKSPGAGARRSRRDPGHPSTPDPHDAEQETRGMRKNPIGRKLLTGFAEISDRV